jgi:hypothetical protein
MLHCGAHHVTRNELAALPLPEARGPRHVVRPFAEDVDLVELQLNELGLVITDEAFGTVADHQRYFGVLEVAPLEGEWLSKNHDYSLMVGLRGSYDQSIARGLAIGSRVFVCDNLAFSGEVSILTKQTTNVGDRLPRLMRDAVAQIPQLAEHQNRRFEVYRNVELRPRAGDAMVIELLRRGVINTTQVERVVREWDTPSHAEHAEQGYSVWRMHNAVTEGIKPTNPGRFTLPAIWTATTKLTGFLDEVAGL